METKKIEVGLSSAYRLLYPRHVVLVSCVDRVGKANIMKDWAITLWGN